ncbi:MAG: rhodanese-like domain-containing protein [Woeseiaceae bacterium]|nr:rhodanese-like domain-containing protein [Woeseiaceae bacterium]
MQQSTGPLQRALVISLALVLFASRVCAETDQASAPESGSPSMASPVPQKLLLSYLADNSTFTLIDARSIEEFQTSHIQGAINIPHDASIDASTGLPTDLDAPIVVYCRSGRRATALQLRLRESGYTDVQVLQSGQISWFEDMPVFNCGVPVSQDSAKVLTNDRAADGGEEPK